VEQKRAPDSARVGSGRGGKRPGAGRPKGVREALPRGVVKAIKAMRHRVPEGTRPEVAELADEALATVVDVMRGKVKRFARERLAAASVLREEVCGKASQKLEHQGSVTINVVDPYATPPREDS
jgi:hypothetical protein